MTTTPSAIAVAATGPRESRAGARVSAGGRATLPFRVALCVGLWLVATTLVAQDRTALVIANFDYGEHQAPHAKPDAARASEALRREGFRVTEAENVPAKELKGRIERFARSTVTRGVAICYFAGFAGRHAGGKSKGARGSFWQGAGKPSDARNVERDSLALAEVIELFAVHSAAATNLLVVDAPAANPFLAGHDEPLGFAAIEQDDLPPDVGVLFAHSPRETQADSSQLAAAFARRLARGRESIGKLAAAVTDDVRTQTKGGQTPSFASGRDVEAASWSALAPGAFLSAETLRDGEHAGQRWTNSFGMVFCWCPPGTFRMGAPQPGRPELEDAEPVEVTLTEGFWIGRYEVTQLEAERLKFGARRYSFPGKHLPLHGVQQNQASKLCTALRDAERKTGLLPADWGYSLPTEAQWEYACRAGTTTRYHFGDDESKLGLHANFADRSLLADDDSLAFPSAQFDDGVGHGLALVGSYRPNAWGLHDMHGNVAEWCADRYLPRLLGGTNPLADEKTKNASPYGIVRGGAWCSIPGYCESGFRNSEYAGGNAKNRDFLGFRLILRKSP